MLLLRIIIVFFILFNFPVPFFYNSALVSVIISSVIYLINPNFITGLFYIAKKKYVLRIFLSLIIVVFCSFLPAIIHLTFDFKIVKAFVLQLFLLLTAIFAYPIVINKGGLNEVLKILIAVFLVQSCIEILAFTNSSIADFVHYFQSESVSEMSWGLRALALSGNPFFDLAAAFGLMYIFFFKYVIDKSGSSFHLVDIIIFVILFIGTFFAGRTGFIGFLVGLILYCIEIGIPLIYKVLQILKFFGIITLLSLFAFVLLPENLKDNVTEILLPFAFEFIYNYLETGKASTESTDILHNMYFPISWKTFFIGDGRYSNPDGTYYMYTDAGFMRHILYFGILGLFLTFVYQLQFFRQPMKLIIGNLKIGSTIRAVNDLLFFAIIFIYLCILHYKGEVIGFLPIIQIMILFVCIGYSEKNKYKTTQ